MTTETPSPAARPFSEVTRVIRTDERTFTADVDAEWTVTGKPNGGYLVALWPAPPSRSAPTTT